MRVPLALRKRVIQVSVLPFPLFGNVGAPVVAPNAGQGKQCIGCLEVTESVGCWPAWEEAQGQGPHVGELLAGVDEGIQLRRRHGVKVDHANPRPGPTVGLLLRHTVEGRRPWRPCLSLRRR